MDEAVVLPDLLDCLLHDAVVLNLYFGNDEIVESFNEVAVSKPHFILALRYQVSPEVAIAYYAFAYLVQSFHAAHGQSVFVCG